MKFAVVGLDKRKIRKIIRLLCKEHNDLDSEEPDFVITYGGDGTILFAERKYPGVPKITIRGSSRGFKCLYTESDLERVLSKIAIGEYRIHEELKLETHFAGKRYLSLNETQVHNISPISAIRLEVFADDQKIFGNVIGDGVVIATPFGSTAYFSSVGGVKFDKGIGIALNNPYVFDDYTSATYLNFAPEEARGEDSKYAVIDPYSKVMVKILRDDGLLLFDNDEREIRVKGGDEIIIKVAKEKARFLVIDN